MFGARPPDGRASRCDLHLLRAQRAAYTGSARFLADPVNRARVAEYLADMARPYAIDVPAELICGHSYGEMAEPLITALVPPDEPVDLMVLAFSIHDVRPGRQTAAYLSHVTPGSPMAFAVCDQGPAAAFTGLRIVREYFSAEQVRRAVLIVVEQAAIPYDSPARVPSQHQAVAMLYGRGSAQARVTEVCQHPGVAPERVAELARAEFARLTAGHRQASLVLSDSLAATWPAPAAWPVRVMPAGQPVTGIWWGIIDELDSNPAGPLLVVAADYDPALRYLCLTAFEKEPAEWDTR